MKFKWKFALLVEKSEYTGMSRTLKRSRSSIFRFIEDVYGNVLCRDIIAWAFSSSMFLRRNILGKLRHPDFNSFVFSINKAIAVVINVSCMHKCKEHAMGITYHVQPFKFYNIRVLSVCLSLLIGCSKVVQRHRWLHHYFYDNLLLFARD